MFFWYTVYMNEKNTTQRQRPIPHQIYRHFKGNTYQINCIAVDSEDGKECVVYQALYGDYRYYVRPLDMFMSEVDHEKYPDVTQKYRFELVSPVTASPEPAVTSIQSVSSPSSEKGSVPPDPDDGTVSLDPDVEAFLDADTYEQRLEILSRLHYKVDDDMIDIMSTVLDIEIPAGRVSDRYERFKDALMMRRSYEAGRLR